MKKIAGGSINHLKFEEKSKKTKPKSSEYLKI